jgi:hypothetical protein
MKILWCVLLCVVFVAEASAQQPVITPDTPVDTATLHQWLHSGDPRLIAWAADFARRKHDATILAEMPDWLEHWPMPAFPGEVTWPAMQTRALVVRPVLAVLDALIQENVKVSLPAINAVAEAFPAQAAILISRYPLSESRYVLDQWIDSGEPILARIATMMFAKEPQLSTTSSHLELTFVAGIVADSEMEVRIAVASDSAPRPLTGGATCGDSEGRMPERGWPVIYTYELAENNSNANGSLVVEVGEDRIATMRYKENEGWGSCYYPQRFNSYTRHELIAYWLGIKPQDMAWQPVEPFTIQWTGKAAYYQRLGEIVDSERRKLRATSAALRQRGVLTGLDAAPKLVVTVQCDLKPCPLQ